jgi:hypothetical protein
MEKHSHKNPEAGEAETEQMQFINVNTFIFSIR